MIDLIRSLPQSREVTTAALVECSQCHFILSRVEWTDVSLITRLRPSQGVLFAATCSPPVLLAPQLTHSEVEMSPPLVASASAVGRDVSLSMRSTGALTPTNQVVLSTERANYEALS